MRSNILVGGSARDPIPLTGGRGRERMMEMNSNTHVSSMKNMIMNTTMAE